MLVGIRTITLTFHIVTTHLIKLMETRKQLPTLDRLDELFYYSKGQLRYKTTRGKCKAGSVVGKGATDYVSVYVDGSKFKLHRLVWKIVHREEPPLVIDHINRDKGCNRITNLRASSKGENFMNCDHYERIKPAGRRARRTSKTSVAA